MRSLALLIGCAALAACGSREGARDKAGPAESAVQPPPASAGDQTVATVDGVPIGANAVRREIIRRGGDFLDRYAKLEEKEKVVEDIVRTKIFAEAALREGYAEDPALLESIDKLLAERYWRDQIYEPTRRQEVPDAEVEAYYRAHSEEFTEPERVRGAVIFLEWRPGASAAERAAARQKAVRLLAEAARLPSGERTFGPLAAEHSDHSPTRARGGDTGFIVKGGSIYHLDVRAVEALFALRAPGDMGSVVETPKGLWLVRLVERAGGETTPLERVAPRIRGKLNAEKSEAAQAARLAALRKTFDVRIDRDVLATVGPDATAAHSGPPSFPLGEATP